MTWKTRQRRKHYTTFIDGSITTAFECRAEWTLAGTCAQATPAPFFPRERVTRRYLHLTGSSKISYPRYCPGLGERAAILERSWRNRRETELFGPNHDRCHRIFVIARLTSRSMFYDTQSKFTQVKANHWQTAAGAIAMAAAASQSPGCGWRNRARGVSAIAVISIISSGRYRRTTCTVVVTGYGAEKNSLRISAHKRIDVRCIVTDRDHIRHLPTHR